jgi:competence protein ComEA
MDDERRWQMVAWAVAAAVVVFLGARWVGRHGDDAGAVPPARVEAGPAARTGSSGGAGQPGVYVHVAGAVRRPGLYRVRAGTRVAGAIQRAGGGRPRANLSAVNLAARVEDGQQVVVPGPGTPAAGGAGLAGAAQAGGAGGAKVSLGQASLEQLDGLDGIGPTLAKRIVEYRTRHGGFHSLEQLQEVDGIGPKRFAALRKALAP